jgi:hypothetical protein
MVIALPLHASVAAVRAHALVPSRPSYGRTHYGAAPPSSRRHPPPLSFPCCSFHTPPTPAACLSVRRFLSGVVVVALLLGGCVLGLWRMPFGGARDLLHGREAGVWWCGHEVTLLVCPHTLVLLLAPIPVFPP